MNRGTSRDPGRDGGGSGTIDSGAGAGAAAGAAARGTLLERLRALCPTVSVGVLSADQMKLGEDVATLQTAGMGIAHFDVMDGCFCPALTVGPAYIKAVHTPLLKDVHLMIREPLERLRDYVAAGADIITVQLEASVHIHRVLQHLGGLESVNEPGTRIVRGLALCPATPLERLTRPLLEEIDMVVLLAVDPGWSGQVFAPSTLERLARVKELVAANDLELLTCVDGGITAENIGTVAAAGADLIVTGSAVFAGGRVGENAAAMLAAVRR